MALSSRLKRQIIPTNNVSVKASITQVQDTETVVIDDVSASTEDYETAINDEDTISIDENKFTKV